MNMDKATIIALVLAAFTIFYLNAKCDRLASNLATANATIEARDTTIIETKVQMKKVQDLDSELNKELHDANQKIASLESELSLGAKRVFVKSHCPTAVSNKSSTASTTDARACELNQDARQDYLRLRREFERSRLQIVGLQGYIKALPFACVQGNE